MQYHLNGFNAGDPRAVKQPDLSHETQSDNSTDNIDVLIVGSGPAGLTLAAFLAEFPSIKTRIIERNPTPLEMGQADGIACRSVEMFEAFGFAERVMQEAYWVNETSFWRPDSNGVIARHNRIQDVEDGLSEFPHLILSQARVHDYYLELMRNSKTRLEVDYNIAFRALETDANTEAYPVTATLEHQSPKPTIETVKAAYVVGCDGGRSTVRQSLDLDLHGDSANKAWGVMDVLATTDFPDIRLKCAIQSAENGSVLIIPREGGYLVRLYIEFDSLDSNERISSRKITADDIIAKAQRIFDPYTLEIHDIVWWSVYEIGQRLCDSFDDVPCTDRAARFPRVFIAGDACHTHSPKAGQGMNVSMADTFNLGWKLASVLTNRSTPDLLHTYNEERHAKAEELIEFDKEMARLISARDTRPDTFQKYFIKHGRYTAGVETHYSPSLITTEPTFQHLAKGYIVGKRFHSAPVIRLADAKPMELAHTIKADGRWRLFIFADNTTPDKDSRLFQLCENLKSADSPVTRYTPESNDIDSVIDVRAILRQEHRSVALKNLHPFLLPRKGQFGLTDYEKVFCPHVTGKPNIFDLREIDQNGCMIVVRPDQYIASIFKLDAYNELLGFFDQFLLRPDGSL